MTFDFPDLDALNAAAEVVYRTFSPTPQINWPLLSERCGTEVWVKHENHLPTGAFKIRGGLTFMSRLAASDQTPSGVIAATRGNHGQSVAMAAAMYDLPAVIVVPYGNNLEKNAAMRAFGAELIEHGSDFQEALEYSEGLAQDRDLMFVPSYHSDLITGVGTYGLELLSALPDLQDVIVPIGLGSGISGVIAARNALEMDVKVYGVVAEQAPAYALSFEQKQCVSTNNSNTLADGVACRTPNETALEIILDDVEDVFTVSEEDILKAITIVISDTHNLAEGAGALGAAALLKHKPRFKGRNVALVLSGGNLDRATLSQALAINC